MKPRSINIFLLDGDPNGIRVAQIMMSTIQAIAFRRNKLGEVRKTFPEIERPGVYILIGEDENEPDRQLAYIGESEAIGDRLATHNSNKAGRDSKEFWTDTVVLISKDENLTKSHARGTTRAGYCRIPRCLQATRANCPCPTAQQWTNSLIKRKRWLAHWDGIFLEKYVGDQTNPRNPLLTWQKQCPRTKRRFSFEAKGFLQR